MSLIRKNFTLQHKNEFGLVFILQKIPVIQTFVKRKVGVLHRTNFKLVLRTWQLITVTEAIVFYIITQCEHKVDVTTATMKIFKENLKKIRVAQ